MDYSVYKLSILSKIKYSAMYMALFLFLGCIFYGTPFAGLAGITALPFLLKRKAGELSEKRRRELLMQFKELILSFANALRAGYSIENAFIESHGELKYLYDEDALIMKECRQIISGMQNQLSISDLLTDLGRRSGIEEIKDFAAVFSVARKSGGNLTRIISDTTQHISDKLSVSKEIELMFAEKRFEQKIMNVLPMLIMLYISVCNPGYFDPLYGNVTGIVIMSVCLASYAAAFFLSQKIMDIRI